MIGRPRVHHRCTDSTNERAKELAAAGAPDGTLVTADEQTAGRGRQGRSWVAAPGDALLASVVVRGLEPRHALLPLAAAVAVCEASAEVAGVECAIKWPNDVWHGERKLAGILVEGRPREDWAVVGIGVNVSARAFPPELEAIATSLALARGGEPPPRAALLETLLRRLAHQIAAPAESMLAAWRARDALRGREVAWERGSGEAAGVDDSGALLVRTSGGIEALQAGEVHLRAPARAGPA